MGEPTLAELIAEWEAENATQLLGAVEFLRTRFVYRTNPWPWDRSEEYKNAALEAMNALLWILQPLERREVKFTTRPYTPDKPASYDRIEEAVSDE